MLGKLVKYELKSSAKNFIPIYVGLMLVTIIQVCLSKCDYFGIETVENIASVVLVGGFGVVLVVTAMCIHNRFKQNLLTDEGYLMFTLPVKTTKLINSKIIGALIWSGLSIISTMVAIYIRFCSENDAGIIEGIKGILSLVTIFWRQAEKNAETSVLLYFIASIIFIISILILLTLVLYHLALEDYKEKNSKNRYIYYLQSVIGIIVGVIIWVRIIPWTIDIVEGLDIAIEFKMLIYSSILAIVNLEVYIELIYELKNKVNL